MPDLILKVHQPDGVSRVAAYVLQNHEPDGTGSAAKE
jgi:hypothetical protein